ncbi:YggT family protein [Candidatus Saccharibacteria bacterium]|nr:YggT family protein [Candidatus Saccharibacteria bacterium]
MSERVIRERVNDDRVADDTVVDEHPQNVVARIVWLIAGIIIALLAFRFILALLGANPANAFANFIYDVSRPFVAPFFGLFSYNNINYGVSRFEVYTLVAMAVYAVIAWGIVALVNISRR